MKFIALLSRHQVRECLGRHKVMIMDLKPWHDSLQNMSVELLAEDSD